MDNSRRLFIRIITVVRIEWPIVPLRYRWAWIMDSVFTGHGGDDLLFHGGYPGTFRSSSD